MHTITTCVQLQPTAAL